MIGQCDEVKPACTNCLRHSVECDYQSGQSISRSVSPSTQGTELRLSLRRSYTFYSSSQSDFRPPKRGNAAVSKRQQEDPPTGTPSNTPCDTPSGTPSELTTASFGFSGADMELFHHYLTSEELGADKNPEAQTTMHSRLPRLGFSFHYVLHLILAFSGFHLARIQRNRESMHYVEAERHYGTALRKVTAAIPFLNQHNCHALYMAAILVFICSFAKGPRPDEFLAFRDDGNAGYLFLFMGIRSILENCSPGVLEIHSEATEHNSQPSSPNHNRQVSGYSNQIEQLRTLIVVEWPSDDHRLLTYTTVLDRLHRCFDSIYGHQLPLTDGELWPQIFGWLYTLPNDFVADLQHRNSFALMIFAFYTVLLKRISSVWFIQGWPEHIIAGIHRFVPEEYQLFIQWPMEQMK